jgi:hypothetical protein
LVAVPGAGGGKWIVVGGYSVGRGGATGFRFVAIVMYVVVMGSRDERGGGHFPEVSLRLEGLWRELQKGQRGEVKRTESMLESFGQVSE